MAICIYTYIYVTSSRLIGWKFYSKLQFNVSFSTHGYTFHPFFRARRKYSLQPSIIFKILLLHGTVCTVYLQHVSYFACSRYLYTSKKKKKSPLLAQINRPTILLSCTSNVRICLSVCLLSLFFFFIQISRASKNFTKRYYIYIIFDRSRYDRTSSIIDQLISLED